MPGYTVECGQQVGCSLGLFQHQCNSIASRQRGDDDDLSPLPVHRLYNPEIWRYRLWWYMHDITSLGCLHSVIAWHLLHTTRG